MPLSAAKLFQVGCVDLVHIEADGAEGVVLADTGPPFPRCCSCKGRIGPGSLVCDWEGGDRTIKHAVCPAPLVYIHRACDERWPDDC